MRDIRQDLKERIAAEHARREPHQEALAQIDQNIARLTALLDMEEGRTRENGAAKAVLPRPAGNLEDYLMKLLEKGPRSLNELRAAAEAAGYFEGSKESPGRAIHGKLLNPMRVGTVVRGNDKEKKYRLESSH